MEPSQDFRTLQQRVSSALVDTTRTVGQLSAEDLSFQRSLDPDFAKSLDKQSDHLLRISQNLFQVAVTGSEVEAPQLREQDDLENSWRGIVDVVDSLLERADTCLDEYTGFIKRLSPGQTEQTAPAKPKKTRRALYSSPLNITKPQQQFINPPNNNETSPFRPLLKSKPHAVEPLDQSFQTFADIEGVIKYKNPYEAEINAHTYPDSVFRHSDPKPYKPLNTTAATYVDTPEAVRAMLEELKNAKEIAIDLEHHDLRSYVGIVCLMQISTRDKDWIVDTLKPWREELQVLNEVFTDPNILKVFHGAFMDIMWLQRDFGLYVVGLFDTYHAARALGYPQASLASLLSRFIKFDADKQYQMADWRVRPLPKEMLDYACSDTHFLLYIYDNMRNQLIEKAKNLSDEDNPLNTVLQNSKETALQCYERDVYDEVRGTGAAGWKKMLSKASMQLSKEQLSVFRAVHQWRDRVARENDDSVNFVMPRHVLFAIAKAMPMDMASLLGVSHPISQPVRTKASELLDVIHKAKVDGVNGPDMVTVLQHAHGAKATSAIDQARDEASRSGKVAQLVVETNGTAAPLLVRSEVSTFWGSTFGSSTIWSQSATQPSTHEDIRLALPLPQLTAEIFKDPRDMARPGAESADIDPGARAAHQYVRNRGQPKNTAEDDVFVLKELGGSRKRKAAETQEEESAEAVPTTTITSANDAPSTSHAEAGLGHSQDASSHDAAHASQPDLDKARLKAERKAERKALKRLKRDQEAAAMAMATTQGNAQAAGAAAAEAGTLDDRAGSHRSASTAAAVAQPFDYANAPSVLHAKTNVTDPSLAKRGFDPYAKAAALAPQGARKARREQAGRSHTFKG